MRVLLRLLSVSMLVASLAQPVVAATDTFAARITGSQEVPAVKTEATGELKLNSDRMGLSFQLNVENLVRPTAAHIHRGKRGENGPPLAGLFGGPAKEGNFSGILAEGLITKESLLGELRGKDVADLLRLIKSGETYLNIHTETFPEGEIRGQITTE